MKMMHSYPSLSGCLLQKKKKAIHRMRLRDVLLKEKADIVISMFDYDFDILCDVEDGSSKILEYHFSREAK